VAILFTKMRLPKAQEVLDMIYSRRETVKSTVDGIKAGLWETRDRLTANIADLAAIYEGLLKGERLVERDRYFGELLIEKLTLYLPTIEDAIAKQNLEQVLADVTTAVINLKTEENANYLFFSGAQNLAKLTNMQISNINGISRLLERSVLANLGLRVVSAELATSINVTEQMKKTIGDTIKDTSEQINESTDKLIAARSSATINLDALEAACSQMEEVYEKMATANKEVIEKGGETSKHLSEMNAKLRQRVENSHNQMQPLDGGKQ